MANTAGNGGVTVLDASEYQRILGYQSYNETQAKKKDAEEQKQEMAMTKSKTRRQRILDADKKRETTRKHSALEVEAANKAKHLLAKAERQRLDQMDEVKKMNEMANLAKVMAIRDAQKKMKTDRAALLVEEEAGFVTEIERATRKAYEQEAAKEARRKEGEAKAAAIIRDQIQAREHERLLAQERLEQEAAAQLDHIRELNERDAELAAMKVQEVEVLRKEIVSANAVAIARKKVLEDQERAEDLKIAEYLKAKDRREAEIEAQKEVARRQREEETAKLRAQQERAKDKHSARDELLARRAAFEQERRSREAAKKDEEKRKKMQSELADARAVQMAEAVRRKEARKAEEDAEYVLMQRKLEAQKAIDARKEKAEQQRKAELEAMLRTQITEKERRRRAAASVKGKGEVADEAERRAMLCKVRDEKIAELRQQGVPEEYLVPLLNAKY